MIKIFGIMLIIFSGCGVGIYFSERLSDKVRRLEKLKYMTDEIMTLIRSVLRISEMNGLFARTGAVGQKKIVYSVMKKEIG